jgi:hypothetical protein
MDDLIYKAMRNSSFRFVFEWFSNYSRIEDKIQVGEIRLDGNLIDLTTCTALTLFRDDTRYQSQQPPIDTSDKISLVEHTGEEHDKGMFNILPAYAFPRGYTSEDPLEFRFQKKSVYYDTDEDTMARVPRAFMYTPTYKLDKPYEFSFTVKRRQLDSSRNICFRVWVQQM